VFVPRIKSTPVAAASCDTNAKLRKTSNQSYAQSNRKKHDFGRLAKKQFQMTEREILCDSLMRFLKCMLMVGPLKQGKCNTLVFL